MGDKSKWKMILRYRRQKMNLPIEVPQHPSSESLNCSFTVHFFAVHFFAFTL